MEIRSVLSDGLENPDQEFDLTVHDKDGNPYRPPVTIHMRSMPKDEWRKIKKQAEEFVKTRGRGMERQMDADKAADLVIARVVKSWTNIHGGDGKPLVCTPETVIHLPEHVKAQVIEAALSTEAVDQAESFPELTRVV